VKVLDATVGRELGGGSVSPGSPLPIDVPVNGVVRLRLLMTDPDAPNLLCGSSKAPAAVIWGDAQLVDG
jgi:hypothetical protein